MDYLWQEHYNYTWIGFLGLILELGLLYFAMYFVYKGALRIGAPSSWQTRSRDLLKYILLVFEPLALLGLLSYWVLIHPFFHGLIVLLLLIINFGHFKNYFSGRILLFNHSFRMGSRLKNQKMSGVVTKIERLGIRLQFDKGIHFISYADLLKEGFSLLDQKEKGGFFRLRIHPLPDAPTLSIQQLMVAMNESPYINWNYKPAIKTIDNSDTKQWTAYIALHQERHLTDVVKLLEEKQFSCQVEKL